MKLLELLNENEIIDLDNQITLIPSTNIGYLKDKISELNKKAVKLGLPKITINISNEKVFQKINGKQIPFLKVSIHGQSPKIEGWTLIAALDYINGTTIIRAALGENIPPEFRNANPSRCDHCHSKRDRVSSYLIKDQTGDVKQVGRSCLKDFLGHRDPKFFLQTAAIIRTLDQLISQASSEISSGHSSSIHLDTYLAYVAANIRLNGWTPKSAGKDHTTAQDAMQDMFNVQSDITPNESDHETASKALNWVRTELPKKKNISDYEHNLIGIGSRDIVDYKHTGFAASMVAAYQREKSRELQKQKDAETKPNSNFVGEIGDKLGSKGKPPLKLQVLMTRSFESAYGVTHLYRFVDENGNFFVWFASSQQDLEIGKWYNVSGTVKKHDLDKYNGNAKTTYITRVKIL